MTDAGIQFSSFIFRRVMTFLSFDRPSDVFGKCFL